MALKRTQLSIDENLLDRFDALIKEAYRRKLIFDDTRSGHLEELVKEEIKKLQVKVDSDKLDKAGFNKIVCVGNKIAWYKTLHGSEFRRFFENHRETMVRIESGEVVSAVVELYPSGSFAQYELYDHIPGPKHGGIVNPVMIDYADVIRWVDAQNNRSTL